MRDIKFRIWEPLNEKMHYPNLSFYELSEMYIHHIFPSTVNQPMKSYQCMNLDSVEVMEFSGIPDKNQKDGYENDIVQRGKSIGIIKFKKGHFYIDWGSNPELWSETLYIHLPEISIIGNIYENPDLLN